MVITHTNRKRQTYYLHQGQTKTGKPKYFFSQKTEGNLSDIIPDGFEIYENPNAQVFLRKILPKIITEQEIAVVEKGLQNFCKPEHYLIDVKKEFISIFTSNQNIDALSKLLSSGGSLSIATQQKLQAVLTYSSCLRFILVDKQHRTFQTQRFCYLGSIDDWINIGSNDQLENLVETYVKHIDQESFYNLL